MAQKLLEAIFINNEMKTWTLIFTHSFLCKIFFRDSELLFEVVYFRIFKRSLKINWVMLAV